MGFSKNLYVWDETATFVTTPVIKTSVKDTDDNNLELVTMGSVPALVVRLSAQFPDSEPEWILPASNDTMTYHAVNLTQDGSSLMVKIDTQNESLVYNVFLMYNNRPSLDTFDMMASLQLDNNEFTFIFKNVSYTNGSYFVGVSQRKCIEEQKYTTWENWLAYTCSLMSLFHVQISGRTSTVASLCNSWNLHSRMLFICMKLIVDSMRIWNRFGCKEIVRYVS